MKKTRKMIIIVAIIVICFIIWMFKFTEYGNLARWYLSAFENEKKLEGFDTHKDDYQIIVDKIIKLRNEGKDVKENDYLLVEDNTIRSIKTNKKLNLMDKEKESLKKIEKTFIGESCPMEWITLYNDLIEFRSENCTFGVIYSENGNKPTSSVDYDDFVIEYEVKKLTSKWYTIEEK